MKSGQVLGRLALTGIVSVLAALSATANGLVVASVELVMQNTGAKTVDVMFDLSWSNSWRAETLTFTNWDAAWVFVKFRPQGSNAWEHARLSSVAGDHTVSGGVIDVGSDGTNGVGVFVYSASEHTGDVSYTGTSLRWNYGSNGYNFPRGALVEVSVQAIEMVYVPAGSFSVGSGAGASGEFYKYPHANNAYEIESESAITVGINDGDLYYPGTTYGPGDRGSPIPAAFPKGYKAFYCMKYEITQGQYRDFLNKLIRTQQNARTGSQAANKFAMSSSATISQRNGIRCPGVIPLAPATIVFGCDGNANMVFDESNDAIDRACNQMAWSDLTAYSDWAGLRPMTELEFEKACRGPLPPVANEAAWGNATVVNQTAVSGTDGSGTETALPVNANYFNGSGGPMRAGIYATTNSTRLTSGGSYWGIMDLSGNVGEMTVTAGSATGRSFTGLHGDGKLTDSGSANVTGWPGTAGGELRCWIFYTALSDSRVSARDYTGSYDTRADYGGGVCQGGRAVRAAP